MNTLRGTLIYTVFATVVFIGIQWIDDVRDWQLLAISGVMFFAFTFAMLRLIQRVLAIVIKPRAPRARRGDREPGPAVIEPTTERPDHVRRRRETRRPRGRRR